MVLRSILALVIGTVALPIGTAGAFVKAEGSFVADKSCPAFQSIKKRSNPGNEMVEAGKTYPLLGKNKAQATHYQLRLEGAKPTQRWVAVDCGKAQVSGGDTAQAGGQAGSGLYGSSTYVLAASWQPAFCETRPNKRECKTQTANRFDASNFSLHGLWPQPRNNVYCDVSGKQKQVDKNGKWSALEPIELSGEVRGALQEVMPGYASYLHRHEWVKHGTCYGGTPEEYFAESIDLMEQLNRSDVQRLFSQNIGDFVGTDEIRGAFDRAFGRGAGKRVEVVCTKVGGNTLIGELRLHLKGVLDEGTPIAELLAAAKPVASNCRGGIVDPVGLQWRN
ncbi:ribonuclease T2 [Pseudovibrio flavus]|uniref:ribonuclease T2 n=1 Tax=Pseudovibrio flavus TaxID=2529854 RepID=UPI00211C41F7|nr:ribonuclease T2 [Pseudovibrio flavus]